MAAIRFISYRTEPHGLSGTRLVPRFPVIHRANGQLWREGCAYLAERSTHVILSEIDVQTVQSEAKHLAAFLRFCETEGLNPLAFPKLRAEKPTYRFRAFLIQKRNKREISSSTAATRINTVRKFYQWLMDTGFLSPSASPFIQRNVGIYANDRLGFARKKTVTSSDLKIRNKSVFKSALEGGLHPISREARDAILHYAYATGPIEFALILDLGFRTGMRLQTACGITTESLNIAVPNDEATFVSIRVGPNVGIQTKLGVHYAPRIPADLFAKLQDYAQSSRRLTRLKKAAGDAQNLIFLTKTGRPFYRPDGRGAPNISTALKKLKTGMNRNDLHNFYFHCTRATFGTHLVIAGLTANLPPQRIVKILMELMGHSHISSSLKYLAYVEDAHTDASLDVELTLP